MFNLKEFIKNLSSKKEYVDDKKNYPLVVYENDMIKNQISEWVKFLGGKSFRQVMLDVGFSESDIIYIYNKEDSLLEYYYSVNNSEINIDNYIKISYGAFLESASSLDIYNGDDYKKYEFIYNNFDSDKKSFVLSIDKKEIDNNGKCYIRDYYANMACFEVKNDNYDFVFNFGNMSSFDDINSLVVNNEDKLYEYLYNLEFPIDVIDVYKNIVNICNMDFSKYTFFVIKCYPKGNVSKVDLLGLCNGKFSELKMTKDGKRICLNCYDVWEYKKNNDNFSVKFCMNSSNNNVSYNVSGLNDKVVDSYTLGLLKSDINSARCEIEDTKKLVKMMFNNR